MLLNSKPNIIQIKRNGSTLLIAVCCRMCNNSIVPVNQLATYHKLQISRIHIGAGTKVPRHSSSDELHRWTRADHTQQTTQHEASRDVTFGVYIWFPAISVVSVRHSGPL